ncbi:hypothetical protein OH77DRAFT_1439750 [Trametes cingulata]|nr:hypothetical protein OH77DRAFT_1439750 [Trametes cingulata]
MTYCPLPGTYVVAQIDVQATLAGLDDAKALAAATRLEPKKYLVYLHTILRLPYPGGGPYKYLAYLVGPDPRPEEPENFITSDMYIPIFPNTNHPAGRAPVRPNSPFPFPNCSHWVGWDMERQIRVVEGVYPEERAIKLPSEEHVDMEEYCGDDLIRSHSMKVKSAPRTEPSGEEKEEPAPSAGSPVLAQQLNGSNDSLADLEALDIFGFEPREGDDLLPVVRIWLDLAGHFTQDDIPSPRGFVQESEALISIVKRAKVRKALEAKKDSKLTADSGEDHVKSTSHALSGMSEDTPTGTHVVVMVQMNAWAMYSKHEHGQVEVVRAEGTENVHVYGTYASKTITPW